MASFPPLSMRIMESLSIVIVMITMGNKATAKTLYTPMWWPAKDADTRMITRTVTITESRGTRRSLSLSINHLDARPRAITIENRISPHPSFVFLKASAISTGMKVPKVLMPMMFLKMETTNAPRGINRMIRKTCWISKGSEKSDHSCNLAPALVAVS